jgi:hypothetical protein
MVGWGGFGAATAAVTIVSAAASEPAIVVAVKTPLEFILEFIFDPLLDPRQKSIGKPKSDPSHRPDGDRLHSNTQSSRIVISDAGRVTIV